MSSEIRAGNQRIYWIISNGNGYIDGVTDPNLVTTVGYGMHIYWLGIDFQEYQNACVMAGIVPSTSPDIPTTSDNPIILQPLMLINNLSQKLDESAEQKEKMEIVITDIETKLDRVNSVIPGQRISARQARLWLIQNGVSLDDIYSVIDSIEDQLIRESIKAEWEYAPYIERNHAWISQLTVVLGLSEEDLDRAFQEASLL
jgi:hypothetical protein